MTDRAGSRGGNGPSSAEAAIRGVRVRRADLLEPGDVAELARLRGQWSEALGGAASESDAASEARLADFLARHRQARRVWLADVEPGSEPASPPGRRRAVGMAGLEVFERMPHRGRPTVRWGYIANVWTDPSYRRLGIARILMAEVVRWSREEGLIRLVLNPSESSVPLYAALGFRPADDLMRLDLD